MAENAGIWKAAVLRGVLAIAAGAALIAWPDIVFGVGVIVYGAYSIAIGLVDGGALLFGGQMTKGRGILLVLAALNILVGALLVTAPQRTTAVVLAIAGVGIALTGVVRLVYTIRNWEPGWVSWVWASMAAVTILIGALFMFEPLVAGVTFVAILGALVLVYGIVAVGSGLALRASYGGGGPMRPA